MHPEISHALFVTACLVGCAIIIGMICKALIDKYSDWEHAREIRKAKEAADKYHRERIVKHYSEIEDRKARKGYR